MIERYIDVVKQRNNVDKRTRLWLNGVLIFCIMTSLCGINVVAGQDMGVLRSDALFVSGNEGGHISVSAGDAVLESVSNGDHMDPAATDPEQASLLEAAAESASAPIFSLQVPNDLDFVIDPWNLAERGQVYSERFIIRNCGNTACTIQLQDIACQGGGGAVIVGEAGQIYEQDAANVYLEMVFDNGEALTLSSEGKEHIAALEPGGELVFWLTGAVNEKTTASWENIEISVKLKYVTSLE